MQNKHRAADVGTRASLTASAKTDAEANATVNAVLTRLPPRKRDAPQDSVYADVAASMLDMLSLLHQPPLSKRPTGRWRRLASLFSKPWIIVSGIADILRQALRHWIRANPGLLGRVAEIILLPALFIYLSWVSNPQNPFYIDSGFPWPWLGPWLIALRYGVGYGAAASFGMLVSWSLLAPTPVFPRLYFLGGAITMLIAGEFGSHWQLRVLRLQESLRFLNDKTERLTRRLYLIKLSHDELEYELVDRPGTLREALIDLRILMDGYTRDNPGDASGLPGAQIMLDFVAHHCRVESAALYRVRMYPTLRLNEVAAVGRRIEMQSDDPMVARALEIGHQVHLQDALMATAQRSSLIVATPLMSTEREPFGVMVISNMPFTAITADNLQTVAVLLDSYADYLRLLLNGSDLLAVWPKAPRGLAGDFSWLTRLRTDYGLESRCVVWRAEDARAPEILDEILALHSRGETAWRWPVDSADTRYPPCVIALVPFSDVTGMRVYRQRLFDAISQRFGETDSKALHVTDFPLGPQSSFERVRRLAEGRE